MRNRRRANTDQSPRALLLSAFIAAAFVPGARHLLFAEGDGAPAAGGAAPASGAPVSSAAPVDGKPADGAPADGAAKPTESKPADGRPADGIIAPVDGKPAEPAKVSADDQRKFLTEKGGKAEDLAKLSEADLQKQYDTAKAAEPKPGEVKAEDIKIEIPEGVTIDDKTLTDFKGLLADAKLTPSERAQKIIDMHVGALKAAAEGPGKVWTEMQEKWQGEVKADKEMGGTNFDATRSTIAKAISDVMGDQAKEVFDAFQFTGAANHPAIVRLMLRVGKALTEGGPISGGALAEGKGQDFGSRVAAMYPSANNGAAKAA